MPTQLFSKLSAKGQVTVPKRVREVIGVKAGKSVAYEIEGSTVRMRRVEPFDLAFHAALSRTLDEWTTKEDDEAFCDL